MEEKLSVRAEGYQKDLLRGFGAGGGGQGEGTEGGGSGEIELSLGLSLGGRFGVEPKEKRLVRSSSISTLPVERDLAMVPPLARTCSLQAEAQEELRKRKELQSLKRLEAKRRRSEKLSSKSRIADRKGDIFDEETAGSRNRVAPHGLPLWIAGAGRAAAQPTEAPRRFGLVSQGSIGSQGSSCSSVSDVESQPKQGSRNSPRVGSPMTAALLSPEQGSHKAVSDHTTAAAVGKHVAGVTGEEGQSRKATEGALDDRVREKAGRNMVERMPCVSTRGDGPNGRRIEGFLYKYRKGEEVKIVCVCHGSFFTPAEFVKHAGGGEVAHPLRHIVVDTLPSAFL
ncbi:ninja-family protein AFP3-like [Musa acuminata AAA Group]|uniref:ninja-family protein AFP3-like n=1 Tax=Musa acuminata AAA Group TaxID=214697 RepID=UPI0031D66BF5